MGFRLPTEYHSKNLSIIDRLKREAAERKAKEDSKPKPSSGLIKGAAGAALITQKALKTYDNLQENILSRSGALDKKVMVQLPDGDFQELNAFVPNSIEKTGNPIKDLITTFTSPVEDRWKVNPDLISFEQEGKLINEATGKAVENITELNLHEFIEAAGGDVSGGIEVSILESSQKAPLTFEDSAVNQMGEKIKENITPDLYKEQVGVDAAGNRVTQKLDMKGNIIPEETLAAKESSMFSKFGDKAKDFATKGDFNVNLKDAYNPLKGDTMLQKAGSIANVASSIYGASRVVTEEDTEEKIHGAIQALTPYLLATGNPLAIGAVALNSIWDMFD